MIVDQTFLPWGFPSLPPAIVFLSPHSITYRLTNVSLLILQSRNRFK